jgi:hypothetical protein
MKEIHPLKRKSIKPSSSTVRGMLPVAQFKSLDAAMQNLRSAGLRLEWQWKSKSTGWVCVGLAGEIILCELRPTEQPLMGYVYLTKEQQKRALNSEAVSDGFKNVIRNPVDEKKDLMIYEFVLETTQFRDLLSHFVEALVPIVET